MDAAKKFFDKAPHGRCNPCGYCRVTGGSGGWAFLGCYHQPYNGKWVAEIKDCPIGKVGGEDGIAKD